MGLALLAECLGGCVEGAEDPSDIALHHAEGGEFTRDRAGIRALGRPEATIAPSTISRANRAAARLGDRTQTGRSLRNHDTDSAAQLAFVTHAVAGDRGLAPDQKRLDDL